MTGKDDDEVHARVRARCERMLDATGGEGFGSAQAAQCRLSDVQVTGVHLDGEHDTVRTPYSPSRLIVLAA